MALNFFSEEWDALRKQIEEDVQQNLQALEKATNEREMALAQGALRALRSLLKLPSKQQKS